VAILAGIVTLLPALFRYEQLLRSQHWSKLALEEYSHRCLEQTLEAASAIRFYRERFPSIGPDADLQSLPTLKRADIPALNDSVRRCRGRASFFGGRSSGSTGMPVEFLFDARHQYGRYAARIRYLRANGWNPAKRNAWIVSLTSNDPASLDARLLRSRLLFRTRSVPLFSPFDRQVEALSQQDPEYLYTFPSNLEGLLQVFERKSMRLGSLRRIFTGGEVLDDSLRRRAREVLRVEISDNYGSTEGFIAWQCPKGTYHLNAEHVLVEIIDEQARPVAPGQIGRVLVTTLENRLMPLVRFEIGDYAIASSNECACGRTLPAIERVIGRGINLFRRPGGSLFSPWPLVGPLKARRQLKQFQIVQDDLYRFIVRFAADEALSRETEQEITKSFCEILKMGVSVSFERVDSIPRTPGGKFMTALSRLGPAPADLVHSAEPALRAARAESGEP